MAQIPYVTINSNISIRLSQIKVHSVSIQLPVILPQYVNTGHAADVTGIPRLQIIQNPFTVLVITIIVIITIIRILNKSIFLK